MRMTATNDPLAHALFEDALLDCTAKLGIVRSRFEGFEGSSFDDLVAGYSSIINRAAEGLERRKSRLGAVARPLRGTPR